MSWREFSALCTLASGVGLCFLSFFLGGMHTVDGSVLMYFGQCLLYAGGIFAIGEYAERLIAREMRRLGMPPQDDERGGGTAAADE